MIASPTVPSAEQLELLSRIVRQVARRRLPPDDAQDFTQYVHLRLLERHYDIFQRFSGRSSLATFVTVIVHRMLVDWRNQTYGRWRPSAAATRLGADAVALERLMYRDAQPLSVAIELLLATGSHQSASALRDLALRLPVRPRPQLVPEAVLDAMPDPDAADHLEREEQQALQRQLQTALAAAIRQLPADDRRLLAWRYREGRSVASLAESLQIDPKALYRRFDRLLQRLRRALGQTGCLVPAPDDRPSRASML